MRRTTFVAVLLAGLLTVAGCGQEGQPTNDRNIQEHHVVLEDGRTVTCLDDGRGLSCDWTPSPDSPVN